MADSTLDPDYPAGSPDRSLGRGHGFDALGPSDRSDTGSDVQGAGLSDDVGLEMDEGSASDRDSVEADGKDIDTDQVRDVEAIDPEDSDVDAGR